MSAPHQARIPISELHVPDTHALYESFGLIGRSPAMQRVYEMISCVGRYDEPVLILGETGTGKELVAHALHNTHPKRKAYQFHPLNCAAIPHDLIESELFGCEKGAFTGAVKNRPGAFEYANGGTLLFDEIGKSPRDLQNKLLRVLQDETFSRVGSCRQIRTNVRVVSATSSDIRKAALEDGFSRELLYRLNTVTIEMPRLCERDDDIMLLATHFADRFASTYNLKYTFAPESNKLLKSYPWPGNVRELEHFIQRAMMLYHTIPGVRRDLDVSYLSTIEPFAKSEHVAFEGDVLKAYKEDDLIRANTIAMLIATKNNKTQAAEMLDISLKTLFNRTKTYALPNTVDGLKLALQEFQNTRSPCYTFTISSQPNATSQSPIPRDLA